MSEPAYVCMECARTTSGKCAQHSYVPMPKQDILGECSALRKRVEELEAHRSVKMGLALEIERDRAMLRAELAEARVREYDEKLSTEMPKDMKDWWQNSKEEWPEVARWVLENRRKQILMVQRDFDAVANALDKLQAALDKLQADLDKLQADLDAALKWIEGYTDGPSGLGPTSQRVRALLEKRREKRG